MRARRFSRSKQLFWRLFDGVLAGVNGTIGAVWRRACRPYSPAVVEHLRMLRIAFWFHRFDRLGTHCGIGRRVIINGPLRLSMGDHSALYDNVALVGNGEIRIGAGSTLGNNCVVACVERVDIGNNVMVAGYCYIVDQDHDFSSPHVPIAKQGVRSAPVVIDDDVWIGSHAVVLRGVHIGRGAVVGANSVVTSDVPEYSVVAGNPARVIRNRNYQTVERA